LLLLAFETSAKAASVALFAGEKLLAESYQNTGLTHSQTLMVMAQDLLSTAGKTPQEVVFLFSFFISSISYPLEPLTKVIFQATCFRCKDNDWMPQTQLPHLPLKDESCFAY